MPKKKSNGVKNWFKDVKKTMVKIKNNKKNSFLTAEVPHLRKREEGQRMIVDITPMSVVQGAMVVMLTILLFYFLYDISSILLIFFISFLFAAALDPLVDKLEGSKVPRPLSMLLIYIVLFFFVGFFVTSVVTLMAEQVIAIAQTVGEYVSNGGAANLADLPFGDQLQPYLEQFTDTVDLQTAAAQLQNAFLLVQNQLVSISVGLFNLLIVLVLAFFMVVEERSIDEFFQSIFPSRYGQYVSTRMAAVKDQVGLWLRGQLMVSVIAGVASYIGLAILGVDYALTLSFIAGLGMVVPVVGRFFAWIVTFPIVFNQSPTLALWMSIYYLIIQQFENNLIVPYVMNKAVGLNPIVIIFLLMVGGQYLGILGFVLAIPVGTMLAIFFRDFTQKEK